MHIIAKEPIKSALEQTLGMMEQESWGDVAIIYLEREDDIRPDGSPSGLDEAIRFASMGNPLVLIGWLSEEQYSHNPKWQEVMRYSKAVFLRMPASLAQIVSAISDMGRRV